MFENKFNIVFTLFLSIPVSLLIWFLHNYVLKTVINQNESTNDLTIIRSFLAIFLPFVLMIYGYMRRSINKSGAIAGLICACTLSLASFTYLIALAAFFFSSSRATKFRENEKKKLEKDFKSGGQRNWIQVICNGGMPTVLALLHLIEGLIGERPIDFQNSYVSSILGLGVMAAFACCNGDTWASELSPVISKSDPVLVTNFKRVPKGTNGGITIIGLVFSTIGGLFIGLFYWLSTVLLVDSSVLANTSIPQFPIILLGAISGLFGSLVDSFLGATCQFSGQTDEGYIVEHPGKGVKKISGNLKILNNHSVNLLSSILTGIVIPGIAIKFWSFFTYSY